MFTSVSRKPAESTTSGKRSATCAQPRPQYDVRGAVSGGRGTTYRARGVGKSAQTGRVRTGTPQTSTVQCRTVRTGAARSDAAQTGTRPVRCACTRARGCSRVRASERGSLLTRARGCFNRVCTRACVRTGPAGSKVNNTRDNHNGTFRFRPLARKPGRATLSERNERTGPGQGGSVVCSEAEQKVVHFGKVKSSGRF